MELMSSFLDSVVDDWRVEIATHDWNSIIHAFLQGWALEDARRTYGRMVFLRFEPSSHTYLGGGGKGGVRPRNKWNKTPEAKGNKTLEEKFQDDGSSDSLQEFGWSKCIIFDVWKSSFRKMEAVIAFKNPAGLNA